MDIRKRYFSSNGGQLLSSIAQEVQEVQDEIDKYIQEHFISYYEDKCEEIPDFIYKANIGFVKTEEVTLIDPNLQITDSIKQFYENKDCAYYQDGFVFVINEIEKITYCIDDYTMEAFAERMHVWNVYDEFATFVGIQRYENETNRELFDRIIETANRVKNSSEDGLKNAIIASISGIVPEINEQCITLERPTAKNLVKYYEKFGTALDTLMNVNKDVLRVKTWDVDRWENDFKRIDYIPHVWDVALNEYTNGIGDGDDLKPIIIDTNTSTDMELSFYQKSDETIDSHIKKKDLNDNLNLSLVKYNNTLDSFTAKYAITASEAVNIHNAENGEHIFVELLETVNGEEIKKISDIATKCRDIEIEPGGILESGKYYRVKLSPQSAYDSIEIYELYTEEESEMTDYMIEKTGFIKDGMTLKNTSTKKVVTRKNQYAESSNILDTGSGVTINNISSQSTLKLNVDDCSGETMKVFANCEMSNVNPRDIILNNFFYDKEKEAYVSDIADEKSITIEVKANCFKANISSGQCMIRTSINGKVIYNETPAKKNGSIQYSTPEYNFPQNMTITITPVGLEQVVVNDLLYNDYDLNISCSRYALDVIDSEANIYTLPNANNNYVNITMRTRTQYAPVISKIYVGRIMSDSYAYISDLIEGKDGMRLVIDSNCKVELYESDNEFGDCDKTDPSIKVTQGYSTGDVYTALSDDAMIVIDTSDYNTIENIIAEAGTFEKIENGSIESYAIKLKTGDKVSNVTLVGQYESLILNKAVHEIIEDIAPGYRWNTYDDNGDNYDIDDLYVSSLLKCFVIKYRTSEQEKVSITFKSLGVDDSTNVSKVRINNLPPSLRAAFVTSKDGETETVVVANELHGKFEEFYLYPSGSKKYVANNEYVTYQKHKEGIEIVNTFNNGYVPYSEMVYFVSPSRDGFNISFRTGENWTIGEKTLTLDVYKDVNFNMSHRSVTEKVQLGTIVPLSDIYYTENKEPIELAQYVIDTSDKEYEVVYKCDPLNDAYIKAEYIDVKSDGFNKLRYSNVADIIYLGYETYDEESELQQQINSSLYEVDSEKGIIVWKDKEIINSTPRLYVMYTIKKAIAVKYSLDYLYEKVQYPIEAYMKLDSVHLSNISDGDKIDLSNPLIGDLELSKKIADLYKKTDIVYVQCEEPGYEASKIDDILSIKKVAAANTLAIKSGWYYMFGKEYYLFATDQTESVVDDEYVTYQEAIKNDGIITLHKKTTNHIKNTKMISNTLTKSYMVKDFMELKALKGSSNANSITACESFNYWTSFAMKITLEKGLNGLGLFFTPYEKRDVAYAILEITDYMLENTCISFYNPDGLNVYIGREKIHENIPLTGTTNISTLAEITMDNEGDIYNAKLTKEKGCKYYIVVRGQGLLDDIIIQDGDVADMSLHTKNISMLNLNLTENVTTGVIKRMFIDDSVGNKGNNTEVDSSGYIVNASSIDWNITKVKTYTSKKDWMSGCELTNVDIVTINDTDCMAVTEANAGRIVTRPIYIGDPNTVSSIIYKINNVPLRSMQGFTSKLLQSQTNSGLFVPCQLKLNNSSSINYATDIFYPYIQLSVEMPNKKVIDSIEIYVEHKSSDRYAPAEKIANNGEFISKVFDTGYETTYKLANLSIEDIEGDVTFAIRAAREKSDLDVWTDWHDIELKDGKVINDIRFDNFRFFQFKACLNGKSSKVKLKHFDLEVKK